MHSQRARTDCRVSAGNYQQSERVRSSRNKSENTLSSTPAGSLLCASSKFCCRRWEGISSPPKEFVALFSLLWQTTGLQIQGWAGPPRPVHLGLFFCDSHSGCRCPESRFLREQTSSRLPASTHIINNTPVSDGCTAQLHHVFVLHSGKYNM